MAHAALTDGDDQFTAIGGGGVKATPKQSSSTSSSSTSTSSSSSAAAVAAAAAATLSPLTSISSSTLMSIDAIKNEVAAGTSHNSGRTKLMTDHGGGGGGGESDTESDTILFDELLGDMQPMSDELDSGQSTLSNGREARNRAEKNRRDKLNSSIQELSGMVPHVAESPRRVDKTAVLRFSAHGLRIDYVFGKSIGCNGPCHTRISSQTTDAFLQLLGSFLLTVTCRGQILLVSPSIEQHLGHCQSDLFGQNLINFTHPDDHALLKRQLVPTNLEGLFDIQPDDDANDPRPRTQHEENEIDQKLKDDKRQFTLRLARAGPRSEPTNYEAVRIDGCFRRADLAPRGQKTGSFPSGLQLIRRSRGRDDGGIPLHTISGNDIVLVAMARIVKQPTICDRLLEACKYEYKTRHLIDGRIVQCDQRISIVAGYLTEEVSGLSPFTFMHKDDVRWVMVALRQMYDYNRPYGESCYRLMSRNGQFIYLKTRGYLEIDKESNKVHSFVCVNTLVSEDEGRTLVKEMKRKFSVIIDVPSAESEVPAVEHPHQIERAIMNLITNLGNTSLPDDEYADTIETDDVDDMMEDDERDDDDDDANDANDNDDNNNDDNERNDRHAGVPSPDNNREHKLQKLHHTETHHRHHQKQSLPLDEIVRQAKSPPLAIIPPNPSTIKTSISKSLNVIVAARKGMPNSAAISPNDIASSGVGGGGGGGGGGVGGVHYNNWSDSSSGSNSSRNSSSSATSSLSTSFSSSFSPGSVARPTVLQKINTHTHGKTKSNGLNVSSVKSSPPLPPPPPAPVTFPQIRNADEHNTHDMPSDTDSRVPPLPTSVDYFDRYYPANDAVSHHNRTQHHHHHHHHQHHRVPLDLQFGDMNAVAPELSSVIIKTEQNCVAEMEPTLPPLPPQSQSIAQSPLLSPVWMQSTNLKRSYNYDNESTNQKRRAPNHVNHVNHEIGLTQLSQLEVGGSNFTPCIEELVSSPHTDLTQLLPTQLEAIDRSLGQIEGAHTVLLGRCDMYANTSASTNRPLIEIAKQQQQQMQHNNSSQHSMDLLRNQAIKTEFRNSHLLMNDDVRTLATSTIGVVDEITTKLCAQPSLIPNSSSSSSSYNNNSRSSSSSSTSSNSSSSSSSKLCTTGTETNIQPR